MNPLVPLAAIEWSYPAALLALALPALVLLLARLSVRPPSFATGALEHWRAAAASSAPSSGKVRRRVPLATWLLCAGLAFAALALAGPRATGEKGERTWRFVVDRSPSMYLASDGSTRIARALAEAERWIHSSVRDDDEVEWCEGDGARLACVRGDRAPPQDWRERPRVPRAEIDWSLHDDDGVAWITDRAPPTLPSRAGDVASRRDASASRRDASASRRDASASDGGASASDADLSASRAGLFASGGAAVPGTVSRSPGTRTDWDGSRASTVPVAGPIGTVRLIGPAPEPIADVVRAWAEARGLDVGIEPRGAPPPAGARDALLVLATRVNGTNGPTARVFAGRDGWSASGEVAGAAPAFDEDGELATWLDACIPSGERSDARASVVTVGPGRVVSTWSAMQAPDGDPAAFAVSWAELLDRAVLPPPDVVSISERADAGPALSRPPRPPSTSERASESAWDAWLASAAVVLVIAAWAARSPGRHSNQAHPSPSAPSSQRGREAVRAVASRR